MLNYSLKLKVAENTIKNNTWLTNNLKFFNSCILLEDEKEVVCYCSVQKKK